MSELGQEALTVLQEMLWDMGAVHKDIVLGDGQLLGTARSILSGKAQIASDGVQAMRIVLQEIGEDPDRPGLIETPQRFMKALMEYTDGYACDNPKSILKVFEDGAKGYDEFVIQRDINFVSLCEHHISPFIGKAHIGYIPNGKIVGLSKLARLVDVFAHRLQVQERLTVQIADCLQEAIEPLGVGVVIEATHTCLSCRGVKKQGSSTVTSAVRGALKNKPEARAEFMSLISGHSR